MYSMWKIMCFFNLKPHKNIALHQIHKIMFFLGASYDRFKFARSKMCTTHLMPITPKCDYYNSIMNKYFMYADNFYILSIIISYIIYINWARSLRLAGDIHYIILY